MKIISFLFALLYFSVVSVCAAPVENIHVSLKYKLNTTNALPCYLAVLGDSSHWASSDMLLYNNSKHWTLRWNYDLNKEISIPIPQDLKWHKVSIWLNVKHGVSKIQLDNGPLKITHGVNMNNRWGDKTLFIGPFNPPQSCDVKLINAHF